MKSVMKRLNIIYFIFILSILFFLFIIIINSNVLAQITGDTVTGEVTQSVGVNITIEGAVAPTLTLLNPKNNTYLTNDSLLLNFTATNERTVWFNLDNEDNTTITSFTYFNTSEGDHTLYLFANNSNGTEIVENVTFNANTTFFTILYTGYQGANQGNSTDFIRLSYEEIQNLSEIILEETRYGKINFNNNTINLTDDSDTSDNQLNLDTNINISDNRIELNANALPNFNVSATLSLYNLNFTDPRILRDGEVCSSSICTKQSYDSDSGTLIFNVTSFTIYSAEETPAAATTTTTTTGIGEGAAAKRDFTVDKERLQVSLIQGETKQEEIVIENTGKIRLKISLNISGIEDFIQLSESSLDLEVGESKTITLNFTAKQDTVPDLYVGKLIVKTTGIQKEVLIAIEVESIEVLFDVKLEIPREYLIVEPGEDIVANIELFNIGAPRGVDVTVEYIIKNDQGEIIVSAQETVGVETRVSFMKRFYIPEDTEFGTYIFYIRVTYNGKVASASTFFEISKESLFAYIFRDNRILIVIIILIIVILIFIIYLRHHHKEHKKLFKEHKKIRAEHRKLRK